MTNRQIDEVRLALSAHFDNIVRCLLPMAYADQMSWAIEEDLLNNFATAAKASGAAASGLLLSTARSKYRLRILSEKMHKRIWVEFLLRHGLKTCEIGDILIVSKYIEPQRIVSRSVCFLQVKASDKIRIYDAWKIDKNQLHLYARWPTIQTCYVGSGLAKRVLLLTSK